MTFLLMLGVANIIYVLSLADQDELNDVEIHRTFAHAVPSEILNSIIYSYNMAIGLFDTAGFTEGNHNEILWCIFICATFMI